MIQPPNYSIRETKPEERRTEDAGSRNAKEEKLSLTCNEILPEVEEDFYIINHEYGEPPKVREN